MTVECEKSLELLSDLRDGSLVEAEISWVRTHLDGCVGCKDVFVDIESIVLIANSLGSENGLCLPG
jgi:hypothetical protein